MRIIPLPKGRSQNIDHIPPGQCDTKGTIMSRIVTVDVQEINLRLQRLTKFEMFHFNWVRKPKQYQNSKENKSSLA